MQKLCSHDPSGKGEHCYCIDIDATKRSQKMLSMQSSGMFKEMIGLSDEDFR